MDSLEILFLDKAEDEYLSKQATVEWLNEHDHDPEELDFDDPDIRDD